MTQQKKNYVLPIAMMFALFAMISFVTGLTNPLGLIVKEQFQAANWMTQLGNACLLYTSFGICIHPEVIDFRRTFVRKP